ncbi:MAG: hypothetical protein AAFV88_11095 [Planctomycetota bacterium]
MKQVNERIVAPVESIGTAELSQWQPPQVPGVEFADEATSKALASPTDFPSLADAIIEGDVVAIAVDPNVPQVPSVIRGALQAIAQTDASRVTVVVRDEATDECFESIQNAAKPHLVVRHSSDQRQAQSYLAADLDANPIYLSRELVDADFVLPITSMRHSAPGQRGDVTGIFPAFCDSATRKRQHSNPAVNGETPATTKSGRSIAQEVPWLLGVQLVLSVAANPAGEAATFRAGTVECLQRVAEGFFSSNPSGTSITDADLVVAALDGDAAQQTWENVLRAVLASAELAGESSTLVVWSEVTDEPAGKMLELDQPTEDLLEPVESLGEEDLPTWNRFDALAQRLRPLLETHRVILHSRLSREIIEPLGLGVIESAGELENLCKGFQSCLLLRAAGFACE